MVDSHDNGRIHLPAGSSPMSLKHYEQQVNDRKTTSAAPNIDKRLLPENAVSHQLAWRKIPIQDVEVFSTSSKELRPVLPYLQDDSFILMPVHPLSENRYRPDELIYSGKIQFSASYRTVFYEPDSKGILDGWIPDGMTLMLKLSLEEPLPGIPGDRRLTRDKVEKCILMSDSLPIDLASDPITQRFEIVPEFFGMASESSGVIFRLLPAAGIMPLFSLYSADRTRPDEPPLIVRHLRKLYKGDAKRLAADLGNQLAGPLVQSLFAGFRAGYALEMHAQNTLFSQGDRELFDCVYFRDLEGVVFSNQQRIKCGLEPRFLNRCNAELHWQGKSMRRWFNRNVDHDLGRIFACSLDALLKFGLIDERRKKNAVASIRGSVRNAVKLAQLQGISWPGRVLPYSRAPWGNGLRPGHYFSTRFR